MGARKARPRRGDFPSPRRQAGDRRRGRDRSLALAHRRGFGGGGGGRRSAGAAGPARRRLSPPRKCQPSGWAGSRAGSFLLAAGPPGPGRGAGGGETLPWGDPPGPALHTAGRELWETGRPPRCSAGQSCLHCPCPEGCLLRPSRHRASLVLASSSAYKRFSELLPKEERENACSARVPKSQILTLPELRVGCLADSGTCCCSLGPDVFGQGHVYPPQCRCSALNVLLQQSPGEAVHLPHVSCANKQLPHPHPTVEEPGDPCCVGLLSWGGTGPAWLCCAQQTSGRVGYPLVCRVGTSLWPVSTVRETAWHCPALP